MKLEMNEIKELLNKRVDLLNLVVAEIITGLLLIAIYKGLVPEQIIKLANISAWFSIDQFIRLVDVSAWPIVFFLTLFYFRKIFAYLFLSIEEFNFFGIKGELKNPRELIEEKAKDLAKQKEEEKEMNAFLAKSAKIIDGYKSINNNKNNQMETLFNEYKKLSNKYKELLSKTIIERTKYRELLDKTIVEKKEKLKLIEEKLKQSERE